MKQELINILVKLKETSSWDLSEELAKWIYKAKTLKKTYITSIISFLSIAIKNSKDQKRVNNLIKAREEFLSIKQREEKEKQEEVDDIEYKISNI